jgi:hypothetical protein
MPLFRERRDPEPLPQPPEELAPVPPPPPGPHLLLDGPILARWFLLYRLEQEIERSKRYGSCLCVLLAEPQLIANERMTKEQRFGAAEAANKSSRAIDLVGWLDDERIIIVLPEADAQSARFAASRLRDEIWILSHGRANQKWQITLLEDPAKIEALFEQHRDELAAA